MDDKSPVGQSYRRNVPVRCVTAEARAIRDKHTASQVSQLFGLPTPAYLDQSARTLPRPISANFAAPIASSNPPPPVVQQRSEPLAVDLAKATQTDSIGDKSTQALEAMEQRAAIGELASRAGGNDGPELGPLLVQIPGASPSGRGPSALVHVTDAIVPVSVSAADAAPPTTTARQTELSSAPALTSRPFDDPNEEWRAPQQPMPEMRRDLRAYRERNVRGQLADTLKQVAPTAQSTKFVALRQSSTESRYLTSAPMKAGAKEHMSDARRNRERNETGELGGFFRQKNDGGLDAAANGEASAGVRVQLHAEESAPLRRASSHSPSKVLNAANGMSAGVSRGSLQNGAEMARANLTVTGPRCRTDDARNYYARNYKGHDIFGAGDSGEAHQPIATRRGTPLSGARVGSSPAADTTRTPVEQLNFHEEQLSAAHSKATESQVKRSTSPQVDHSVATQATGGDARLSPQRTPRCRTAEALSNFERNQSGQLGNLIRGELENSPRAAIRVRAEAVEIARVHRGDHLVENLHSYGTPRNQPDPLLPAVLLHRQTSAANAPMSSAIASEMTRSAVAASARASEQGSVAGERVVKKSAAAPLTARTPTKRAPAAKKGESADAEQSAATPRVAAAGKTAVKKVTRAATIAAPAAVNDSAAAEPQAAEEAAGSEAAADPAKASTSTGDSKQEAKPNEMGPIQAATTPRPAASKRTPIKGAASAKAVPKKADPKKNLVGESDAAPKTTASPKAIQKPAAVGAPKAKVSPAAALDKGETSKAKAIESQKSVSVKRPPRGAGAGEAAAAAAGGTAAPSQNAADNAAEDKDEHTAAGSLERGESVEHLMKPSLSASPNPILNGSTWLLAL